MPNKSSQKFKRRVDAERRTRALSIPELIEVSKGTEWNLEPKRQEFYLVRFNCVLRESRRTRKVRLEPFASQPVRPDLLSGSVTDVRAEVESIDLDALVRETFFPESIKTEITRLLVQSGVMGRLGVEGKRKTADDIRQELRDGLPLPGEIRNPPTLLKPREFELEQPSDGDLDASSTNDGQLFMRFEQRQVHVYLEYVDFLKVRYHLYAGQIRWRREKWPVREVDGLLNELLLRGEPLGTLTYYEAAGVQLGEGVYEAASTIGSAREVRVSSLQQSTSRGRRLYEGAPSLYALSNLAFPICKEDLQRKPWLLKHLDSLDLDSLEREKGFVFNLDPEVRRHLAQQSRRFRRRH